MKPARTHTKPTSRHLGKQPQHIWAYRHSRLTDEDIRVVATVFGISVKDVQDLGCAN